MKASAPALPELSPPLPEWREDALLGGRLRYFQPRSGPRSGIEPVLLAASVPARGEARLLEAGTGAGAGLLCLGARLEHVRLVGIEREGALAALASYNLAVNGLSPRSTVIAGDLLAGEGRRQLEALAPFDHVCANPPWHAAGASPSPDPLRRAARQQPHAGALALWIDALARLLRPRGSLTLILAASLMAEALAALAAAGCGAPRLFPLWPHAGRPARLLLLQARKSVRGPASLLSGLVLHEPDGAFTAAAEAILRGGAATPLGLAPAPPQPASPATGATPSGNRTRRNVPFATSK